MQPSPPNPRAELAAPTGDCEAAIAAKEDEALPISDTNGHHPDLVLAASLPLDGSNLNGFDYEGRS